MTFAETRLAQRALAGGPWPDAWTRAEAPEMAARSPPGGRASNDPPAHLNRRAAPALAFGRFRFVTHSQELSADGTPISLGGRALDVLSVLIEAAGELVTKDELLSRVWPTTTVEENNLQFQISALRKALGPDRDFIKTVSGRGYRFVADVTVEGQGVQRAADGPAFVESDAITAIDPRAGLAPSNLPAPASDIVGREAHLLDVAALVQANRLVTLVGAGGIGKTRLAIEIARRLQPTFEAVWIAEIGSLSDPSFVPSAVAAALGLGAPISAARLAALLGDRPLLLLLDNCEHLINAVADVAETLLHANASLRVIATSREPLRAEGEWVYRVPPLDVPPEGEEDLDAVLRHSAARLFIERTCAAAPATMLGASAACATAKICRRLDGIPLAIELAAARAAALGVEGLAARLDDRLSLLTDGRRTAPPRHQTLRATLDWSYDLLTEPERVVLCRLSVFAGDFTMDTATRTAGFGEIDCAEVVEALASLVAKSLVAADAGPTPRYRLLESTRDYAIGKLTQSGDLAAVIRRHAAAA